MLASHNLYVKKENYSIVEELEATGYDCLGRADGLTGCTFYFLKDMHELMPVDDRVSTYTITIKQNTSDQWYAPCYVDKILYSAHPDRGVVDCDLRH